ncbi:MAG: hypothetical protein RL207_1020 [Bacteroidota bacterium]
MKTSNRVGIRTCSDYSPFGVELDGRTVSGGYRFGYQSQEKDDEIKGDGNSLNFTYRLSDVRLGKFFVRDLLSFEYPNISVYAFSENRLIDAFELEGLEKVCFNGTWHNYDGKSTAFISKALTWVEKAHQGNISAERVQNWKENWYITVENKTDYWGKSIGTEIKFYNNRQDWADDKPFKSVVERDISQQLYAGNVDMSGGSDGANSGSGYSGVKGMYKASDKLDKVGNVVSEIPLPAFEAVGETLQIEADVLRTVADFNTLSVKDAIYNTSVRSLNILVNKSIENHLDKEKVIIDNFMHKTIVNKSTNIIKDQLIVKPK